MTIELPKLLVVDDDKEYLKLVAIMSARLPNLGQGGAVFFSSLDQTSEFLDQKNTQDNPPKLIILNYRVNDLTIIDVLPKLKVEGSPYKKTKVIVISSSISPEERDLCYDLGADQVFDKSLEEHRLNRLLKVIFAK